MENTNLLESKICHFTSFQDIAYFLGTTDANVPQKISKELVKSWHQLLDQAIQGDCLNDVAILVQVINHLIQQSQSSSIQMLISCKLHDKFGLLLGYVFNQISMKRSVEVFGDKLYVAVLKVIIEYSKRMNDHYMWLFQNMLQRFLEIITEKSIFHTIRSQTVELLLGMFCDDDREVIAFLRQRISQDEVIFDQLCENAIQKMSQTGDFQLQECVIELIFRMWPTEVRKQKAPKWLNGNQHLLAKFLAISYDKFDYGVRMFLNEVNSACPRRRVLTLFYKELQVGSQTLTPSNQWFNCVDFCYESKVLDVRYPNEELDGTHKCNWNMNTIRAKDLISFHAIDNTSSRTIDLHLSFVEFTSQVLSDFSLTDGIPTNLIIRFYRVTPLDAQHLIKFASTLFGSKLAEKQPKGGQWSKPKNLLIRNNEVTSTPQSQSDHEIGINASYISLTQAQMVSQSSQRQNLPNPVGQSQNARAVNISRPQAQAVISSAVRNSQRHHFNARPSSRSDDPVPMPPKSLIAKPSTQRHSQAPLAPFVSLDSQTSGRNRMMNNLAIQAISNRSISQSSGMLRSSYHNVELPLPSALTSMNSVAEQVPISDATSIPTRHISAPQVPVHRAQKISAHKPSETMSQRAKLPNSSHGDVHKPSKVPTRHSSLVSGTSKKVQSHPKNVKSPKKKTKAVIHVSSGEDFRPTKPTKQSQLSKSAESLRSKSNKAAKVGKNVPSMKSTTATTSEYVECEPSTSKGSSRVTKNTAAKRKTKAGRHSTTEDSGDAFQEDKPQKSLNEIMGESFTGGMDWKDVIPETQAFLNATANTTADTSADLMLGCLHGIEEPPPRAPRVKAKARSSQHDKTTVKSPMVNVDIPRRITRSKLLSQNLDDSIPLLYNPIQRESATAQNSSREGTPAPTKPARILQKKTTTANKVNSEFQALQYQFSDKENADISLTQKDAKSGDPWDDVIGQQKSKRSDVFSKKKKRLNNVEMTQLLDGPSSDSSQRLGNINNDPVMKSVKKKPFATKFMKTNEQSSKRKSVKFGRLTALKDLNIDPRPGGLEAARADKGSFLGSTNQSKIQRSKRSRNAKEKKVDLPLPFEDMEEIPDIVDNNDSVFQPIEVARDAGPEIQEINLIPSPERLCPPRRRSTEMKLVTDISENSKQPEEKRKKRPRVSFHSAIESDEKKEQRYAKDKDGKLKRRNKARLFDSTSSAASVVSSDASWIKDHDIAKTKTPKLLKTYKGKKNLPLSFPSMDKLTREEVWSGSTSSPGSPEVARSDITNHSVLSGISRLQGLGSVCNLAFDDIIDDMSQEQNEIKIQSSDKNFTEMPQKSLSEVSQINISDWNNVQMDEMCSPLRDVDARKKGFEDGMETKVKAPEVNPVTLEAVRSNNQTPVDTTVLIKIRGKVKRKPEKRKAEELTAESHMTPKNTYLKSKKKLRMRSSDADLSSSHSGLEINVANRSDGLSKHMMKTVGKYINQVNNHWNAASTERDGHLQAFESEAIQCENHHVKLIKKLSSLEAEAQCFIEKFNGEIQTVMTEAASNVLSAKSMHSSLSKKLGRSHEHQNQRMERLNEEISKELRRMIQNTE